MLKLISKLWQKIMFWIFFGNGKSKWDGGHEPSMGSSEITDYHI